MRGEAVAVGGSRKFGRKTAAAPTTNTIGSLLWRTVWRMNHGASNAEKSFEND